MPRWLAADGDRSERERSATSKSQDAAPASVEGALRRAAVALRRTVVDLDRIFGEGRLLRVAAAAIDGGADGSVGDVLDVPRAAATAAARDWTRDALVEVRDLGAKLLRADGCGGGGTAALVALRDALRASSDGTSAAWRAACGRLFGEAPSRKASYVSDVAPARRVVTDVFVPGDESDLVAEVRRELAGDVAPGAGGEPSDDDDVLARDVDRLCSPWRSALAPTFARLVDERLCRALDATRLDCERLLAAVEAAMAAAPSALECRVHDAPLLPNCETRDDEAELLERWQYGSGGGAFCCGATAAEISFAAARVARFVDGKFKAAAADAAALGSYSEGGAAAVLAALAPRFAETLGAIVSGLRRRGDAAAAKLRRFRDDERRLLKDRFEDPLAQCWAPTESVISDGPGRRFRRRANLRSGWAHGGPVLPAATVKAARTECGVALVVARACWSLQYAVVAPTAAAVLCGGDLTNGNAKTSGEGIAASRVDVEQLAAAFEIADTDGDGVADWRSCAEAAAAIMVGPCAPRASRGPLRPDLRVVCPSLTLDELVLLSARALDAPSRARAMAASLDDALDGARTRTLRGWAQGIVPPLVDAFADDLGGYAHEWGDAETGAQDPKKDFDGAPIPQHAARALREARLRRLKAGNGWRERTLDVEADDGSQAFETVLLPCEPSRHLSSLLMKLFGALSRAFCATDHLATRDDAPWHVCAARAALWAAAAKPIADAYAAALDEATSDLAPLALLVDAYLLRYVLATRVPAGAAAGDDGAAARAAMDAGVAAFDAIATQVDPIDLELYAPFVKHDATRFYARSALYFDVLSADDDAVAHHLKTGDVDVDAPDWAEDDDAPKDDYLDRPTAPLMAPIVPRFPLLPVDADDTDEAPFDAKAYFQQHNIPLPF